LGTTNGSTIIDLVNQALHALIYMNRSSSDDLNTLPAPVCKGPAWEAAVELGLDMSLVELNLARTPWERLRDHDQALAFIEQLRQGIVFSDAKSG